VAPRASARLPFRRQQFSVRYAIIAKVEGRLSAIFQFGQLNSVAYMHTDIMKVIVPSHT